MKKVILTLILALFVVSCGVIPMIGKRQASLVNTKWTLVENGISTKAPTLNIETNRISGNSGCNNYFSDVVLNAENGNFVSGNIGATKMACNNMSVEQNYLDLLQQVNKYVVNKEVLELYKDNLLLLKFKKSTK